LGILFFYDIKKIQFEKESDGWVITDAYTAKRWIKGTVDIFYDAEQGKIVVQDTE